MKWDLHLLQMKDGRVLTIREFSEEIFKDAFVDVAEFVKAYDMPSGTLSNDPATNAYLNAVAEVQRLTAELAEARAALEALKDARDSLREGLRKQLAEARAQRAEAIDRVVPLLGEIDRLRAALERIANDEGSYRTYLVNIAREALKSP